MKYHKRTEMRSVAHAKINMSKPSLERCDFLRCTSPDAFLHSTKTILGTDLALVSILRPISFRIQMKQ